VTAAESDGAAEGARARLAGRQADLVAALVAGGADPDDFDAARLAATRAALVDKRRAALARDWPDLAEVPDFARRFAAYAAARPPAGTRSDGLGFARSIFAELPDDARVELLVAQVTSGGPALRVSRRRGGRTFVAVRVPLFGPRVFRQAHRPS
jgi:hypothetical protein